MLFPAILCSAPAAELGFPATESFENGVPVYMSAQNSKLSITQTRVQDGKNALRWDYKNSAVLSFKTGPLGKTNVWAGYGGYSRSSFSLRIYLPEVTSGKLVVEFLSGDQVAGFYDIPLQFRGWQKMVHHYSHKSHITWTHHKLRNALDSIRIRAVTEKSSYAIVDVIQYNTPLDFRLGVDPVLKAWKPDQPTFASQPKPTPNDLKKLSQLERVLTRQPTPNIDNNHWKKVIAGLKKKIIDKKLSPGNPMTGNLGSNFSILNHIANQYTTCADPVYRKQIGQIFLSVHSWMQDQGLVVNGAAGKANNYVGRGYVDAIFQMQSFLRDSAQHDLALNYIKWSYGYDDLFDPKKNPRNIMSMDYFHNEARRMLYVTLMHKDPSNRWHHFQRFHALLAKQLIATIKPDGSLFHHGFHYYAYGGMGMGSTADTFAALTKGGFPIAENALDVAKSAAMRMRWYAGGKGLLLSLSGRHPSGSQTIKPRTFLSLAKAYAPYRDGKWDKELVSAYLRLEPRNAGKPEFSAYSAEAAPHGHVTMPYAGLGLHRRGQWLAGVKGFSSSVVSCERYANANRFGIYLSNGYLQLLTHPIDLPSVHASGTIPDKGMSWFALDGTTTIHSTLKHIANGNGSFSERSGGHFNGGLSHDGKNGMFIQKINSEAQARCSRGKGLKGNPFSATKSWFFFENRIVCLGSDIAVNNVNFPVRTTLFQKFLSNDHHLTIANNEPLKFTGQPLTRDFADGHCTLIDPYGNAYFTAKGDPVQLTLSTQHSRSVYDKTDTAGDYATAWIDHGINPESASYSYLILVQPTPKSLAKFQQDLTSQKTSTYQILQQNNAAHIVLDRATQTTAYAIFQPNKPLPTNSGSLLLNAAQPCLVMLQKKPDHHLLSLTYPDPRNAETKPQSIRITIKGRFSLAQLPVGGSLERIDAPTPRTVITIPVLHGESHTFKLTKVQ